MAHIQTVKLPVGPPKNYYCCRRCDQELIQVLARNCIKARYNFAASFFPCHSFFILFFSENQGCLWAEEKSHISV